MESSASPVSSKDSKRSLIWSLFDSIQNEKNNSHSTSRGTCGGPGSSLLLCGPGVGLLSPGCLCCSLRSLLLLGCHLLLACSARLVRRSRLVIFYTTDKQHKVKACIAFTDRSMTELRSVTCHMGAHSVTCHQTQVKAPRLNPSHAGRYSTYLPPRDGRLS